VTDPNPGDYGQFMQAVGREFGGFVKAVFDLERAEPEQELELSTSTATAQTLESAVITASCFSTATAGSSVRATSPARRS